MRARIECYQRGKGISSFQFRLRVVSHQAPKLDPLKDFLTHATSSLLPVGLRRPDQQMVFGSVQHMQNENGNGAQHSPSAGVIDIPEGDDEDGQTTPRISTTTPAPMSSLFIGNEVAPLIGPPSPPPFSLTSSTASVLVRRSAGPLRIPRIMWKRALKSCVLIAKVGFTCSWISDNLSTSWNRCHP